MTDPWAPSTDGNDSAYALGKGGTETLATGRWLAHGRDLPQGFGFAILPPDLTSRPMVTARLIAAIFGSALINLSLTTCRSPGDADKAPEAEKSKPALVRLSGVDTGALSPREHARWSAHVSELLAPCEDTPVSVQVCVEEKRACASCTVAAKYLVTQVRQGKTPAQVEVSYKERFSPDYVKDIDLAGSPSKGDPSAPITIVEWADFECPMCQRAQPVLDEFVKKNEDVRLVFKNFPLAMHEHAETAARASVAADLQGKFWEMHELMFSSQVPLTEATLESFAKQLDLDLKQFKKDLHSEKVADAVARDRKQGDEVKLTGTPTIFINGRLFSYPSELKTGLAEWVALERQLLSSKQKSGSDKTGSTKKPGAPQ